MGYLFREFLPVLCPNTVIRLIDSCFLTYADVQLSQLMISDILGLLARQCSIERNCKKQTFPTTDSMSNTQFCRKMFLNLVEDVQYIKDFDKLLLPFFNPNSSRTASLN